MLAGEMALQRLYPELRMTASRHLDNVNLSCQPSDILHDVWLRLLSQRQHDWRNRAHFFALVARMIRRVLADHVKHRMRGKRAHNKAPFEEGSQRSGQADPLDHFLLDQALDQLALVDPIAAKTVELRYFSGLSFDETAAVLELSRATAVRRWRFARAFLYQQLAGADNE